MPLVFPTPPISTSSAHCIAFLFSSLYLGSLYISKNARLSFSKQPQLSTNGFPREKSKGERWRDDPDVIRARLLAANFATTLCCGMVFGLLRHFIGDADYGFDTALNTTITRLGFKVSFDLDSMYPHLVTPILFIGSFYTRYLEGILPFQKNWVSKSHVIPTFFSWQGIRNYMMGPITEEIVFRACILAIYHMSGASTRRMIFFAPLSFGLAHLHHAWDTFNRYGRTSDAAKRAIIMSVFQLGYTTLFGAYCSYLFLRTSSIFPPISAHIFCNIMGIPPISWELRNFPGHKKTILFAYALGIAGFVYMLIPLTQTKGGFYWRSYQLGSQGAY